jgi:hypothetical protein
MIKNEPTRETGITMIGIKVVRQSRRNRKIITTTSKNAM